MMPHSRRGRVKGEIRLTPDTAYPYSPAPLERALYQTVRYFDVLQLPVTTTQLWRSLVVTSPDSPLRWQGHRAYALAEIIATLRESPWLRRLLTTQWGYWWLRRHPLSVRARLTRFRLAQAKLKIATPIARRLRYAPFVRHVALSGSLAIYNTKPSSDLDVFLVARHGRIWTARLGVLLLAQLSGRRRKYWDQAAPDKICLNHYLTDESLALDPAIRNLYTAVLYSRLIPIYGGKVHEQFVAANAVWWKRFLMLPELPTVPLPPSRSWAVRYLTRPLERILEEPIGGVVEKIVERLQQRAITRHTVSGTPGRVVASHDELAFHPYSRVDGLLHQFAQEAGQQSLW